VDYLQLVNRLYKEGYLRTPLIVNAFKNINRADFISSEQKERAGVDTPLPIGQEQTISQPLTVAFMLELLKPEAGNKILDIGAGSGWTSVLLAWCVGKTGRVFAVERIPEICEFGKKNILKYNNIVGKNLKYLCQDGSRGLPNEAPFDRILVSAAVQEIPEVLKEQLKIGGRLVLPVKNSIWLVIRIGEKQFEEKEFYGFSFVPLVSL
jgi:protein-L-isoaspartate(D-aspartate) O-methyltransferase